MTQESFNCFQIAAEPYFQLLDTTADFHEGCLILSLPLMLMRYGSGLDFIASPGFFCTGKEITLICDSKPESHFLRAFLTTNRWEFSEVIPPSYLDEEHFFFLDDILGANWGKMLDIKKELGKKAKIGGLVKGADQTMAVYLGNMDFITPPMPDDLFREQLSQTLEGIATCFNMGSTKNIEVLLPDEAYFPSQDSQDERDTAVAAGPGQPREIHHNMDGIDFIYRHADDFRLNHDEHCDVRVFLVRTSAPTDWDRALEIQLMTVPSTGTASFFIPLDPNAQFSAAIGRFDGDGPILPLPVMLSGSGDNQPKPCEGCFKTGNFEPLVKSLSLGFKYLACRNCSVSFDKCHHRW